MMVTIDGEQYEIPDEHVREYVAELDEEDVEKPEPEGNSFVFGVHVTHTSELSSMGDDIAEFMRKVGEGRAEVHVSVNAKLSEPTVKPDMVVGFDVSDAIGHAELTESDYWDDEDEPEDYRKHRDSFTYIRGGK